MAFAPALSERQLDALRRLDTCSVSNAIETFGIRLRNTGFADASIRCIFDDLPPMVGYAATARLRSGSPPMQGGSYHDRTEWWRYVLQVPPPRIIVLEDVDKPPGIGAFLGDVHAAILRALGCVGLVTSGAVRELPAVRKMGFSVFAAKVAVSHAYAHIFDVGSPVEIGGLQIHTGDLLHGDRHGLLTVPKLIAADIPAAADKLRKAEERIITFCESADFSLEKLREVLKGSM
ncbi:MAG TPA: RraA family protein [Terriglobia bacterium]|nr:RraA family protein [Terriglobia bacterium]